MGYGDSSLFNRLLNKYRFYSTPLPEPEERGRMGPSLPAQGRGGRYTLNMDRRAENAAQRKPGEVTL